MRILAIDDEKDSRALLRDLLTQAGHRVTTASSAIEALVLVQLSHYDLILLDIMMPGMDGHQFGQVMANRWDTFDIPIVVISCRTDRESKFWAKMNGCVRYLEKPFNLAELLEVIRKIDRGHRETAPVES